MLDLIGPFFRQLYDNTGLNFVMFYEAYEYDRFVQAIWTSILLIIACLLFSLVVGVVGAWAQGAKSSIIRLGMAGYIQFFRNTPPFVQLLFFYFVIGTLTPQVDKGGYFEPMIGSFGWAVISLGFFAGAFNTEIFRSGIEAVPTSTQEAASALGYTRLQSYIYVVLPLAFRVCLPALNNNLVNLLKTTTLAYAIAVPEMMYTANQIWSRQRQRAGDDGRSVHLLHRAGRRAGLADAQVGTQDAHSGVRDMIGAKRNTRRPGPDIKTDMPVLLPFAYQPGLGGLTGGLFTLNDGRLFMDLKLRHALFVAAAILLYAGAAHAAQTQYTVGWALQTTMKWTPFILEGFVLNIVISIFAMAIGTIAGAALGLMQVSLLLPVRQGSWLVTQFFRNSPWLVLLFCVMLLFPFRIDLGFVEFDVPDWTKAVIGFSLPIMANISEVVRGAVISLPSGQWESAESLAFTRRQTMWMIILPQCVKRMIPPWINWYCILTMATPLCSIMGVEESVTHTVQALNAEGDRPELLGPMYFLLLAIHFIFTYPIARYSIRLERRFAVKI